VACHNWVASDRDYRTEVEKADRGSKYKKSMADCDDDDRHRRSVGDCRQKLESRQRQTERSGIKDAMAVGFAQVLSLIPRFKQVRFNTIMAGLFVGETRETAARFSFLLSIPAIAASGLLELREAVRTLPGDNYLPLVGGNNNIRIGRIRLDMVSP